MPGPTVPGSGSQVDASGLPPGGGTPGGADPNAVVPGGIGVCNFRRRCSYSDDYAHCAVTLQTRRLHERNFPPGILNLSMVII